MKPNKTTSTKDEVQRTLGVIDDLSWIEADDDLYRKITHRLASHHKPSVVSHVLRYAAALLLLLANVYVLNDMFQPAESDLDLLQDNLRAFSNGGFWESIVQPIVSNL